MFVPIDNTNRDLKYTLLLMIIKHSIPDGQGIKWTEISKSMPGRTPKALIHVWAKIQKEVADASAASEAATNGDGAGDGALTPAPTTPKPRAKKNKATLTDGELTYLFIPDLLIYQEITNVFFLGTDNGSPSVKKPRKAAAPKKSPLKKENVLPSNNDDGDKAGVKSSEDDEAKDIILGSGGDEVS